MNDQPVRTSSRSDFIRYRYTLYPILRPNQIQKADKIGRLDPKFLSVS